MNGPHDMGGSHSFGRVEREPDEPVFHAPWEGRVFGLAQFTVATGIRKCLDEVRYDMENLDPSVYLAAGYYERWMLGAERGLVRRGVLTEEELERRRAELAADPDAPLPSRRDDELVEQVAARVTKGRPTSRDVDRAPRFAVGDEVVTRNRHTREHTRLARYARGRRGTVDRVFVAFPRPEGAAVGVFEPEHVYAVRFAATELWGESAEPNASVCIDLFESYLRPA
jgi:nitrile hydratase subunit beta